MQSIYIPTGVALPLKPVDHAQYYGLARNSTHSVTKTHWLTRMPCTAACIASYVFCICMHCCYYDRKREPNGVLESHYSRRYSVLRKSLLLSRLAVVDGWQEEFEPRSLHATQLETGIEWWEWPLTGDASVNLQQVRTQALRLPSPQDDRCPYGSSHTGQLCNTSPMTSS